MRLSVDKSDWMGYPAYMLFWRHGIDPVVYVDDKRVDLAIMADTETGEVERYATDESGCIRRDLYDNVDSEIVRGRVTIDLVGPMK